MELNMCDGFSLLGKTIGSFEQGVYETQISPIHISYVDKLLKQNVFQISKTPLLENFD